MQSVMEELYYGNICPTGGVYAKNSPFVQAAELRNANFEKLMASLDEQEKEVFEKYCDAQADIEGITQYDTFTYALKFGILLMTEVFMGKGEVIRNNE